MHHLVLRLDPGLLKNPDLDIRYALPELLAEQSEQAIVDDGYDYACDGAFLLLFFKARELEPAIDCILKVIRKERVLGNDLRRAVVVAVRKGVKDEVVYPNNFRGPFLPA